MAQQLEPIVKTKVPSDKSITVLSPFDNKEIAAVAASSPKQVDEALNTAVSLHNDPEQRVSAQDRIAILQKLSASMASHDIDLAKTIAREGGKPLVDAKVEVARAIEGIALCIETLKTQHGSEVQMGLNAASEGKLAVTSHEPIGVVVAISAFNHPLNLIVHQVAPAIAVGCPVIVKPASSTPISCFKFVQMVLDAGLPEGWCQCLLTEDSATAEMLATDARVDFFTFIGSAKVGWSLKNKLSPGTRFAFEHGGVAPVIVDKDADFETMLPKLTKGGFYHAGQVCVSVQRVYAHESNAEKLALELAKQAATLVVGDPTDEETDVGPLISPGEVDRVEQWVNEAVEQGATLLCGGKRITDTTFMPTVLFNPSDDSTISKNEIFGPVVCVYSYDHVDDAIARANSLPFSFQASVFSPNIDFAMKAYRRLNAAAVLVNEHTAFRVDWMPFGGLKHSGFGMGGIPHTMNDMQIEKMLVINSPGLI